MLTTALPTVVGALAIRAGWLVRLLVGTQLGVVFLSAGAAVGAVAATMLGRPDAVPPAVPLLLGGALGLGALGLLAAWRPLTVTLPPLSWLSRAVLAVAVVLGCWLLVLAFFRPIPNWDAWVMWGMKSKALAATGGFDHPVFTAQEYRYTHPHYPPLFSSWQAVAYVLSGSLRASWPLQVQVAWMWLAGSVGLLVLVSRWGLAAVALAFAWLSAPQMLDYVLTGYPETVMAVLIATGCVLWVVTSGQPSSPRLPWRNSWVPGALLGGAALMKQEALLIGLVVVAAFLVSARRTFVRDGLRCVSAWVVVGAGLWWTVTSRLLGMENPYVTRITAAPAPEPLGTMERVEMIAGEIAKRPSVYHDWMWLFPILLLFLVLGRPDLRLLSAALASVLALGLVYLITPYDLAWQLRTSVARIVMVPTGLLTLSAALWRPRAGDEPPGRSGLADLLPAGRGHPDDREGVCWLRSPGRRAAPDPAGTARTARRREGR